MRLLSQCMKRWALMPLPILLFTQGALAQAKPETSPEMLVQAFYGWYLDEMAKDRTPLQDDTKRMAGYVSPALLKEIGAKMRSKDGMEADYFIRAQDYIDDWLTHIAVAPAAVSGNRAKTIVVLGSATAPADAKQRLAVMLIREKDGWRIRKVSSP